MSGKYKAILVLVSLLMFFTSTYAKEMVIVIGEKATITEKFAAEVFRENHGR